MKIFRILSVLLLCLSVINLQAQKKGPASRIHRNGSTISLVNSSSLQSRLGTVVRAAGELSEAIISREADNISSKTGQIKRIITGIRTPVHYGKLHTTWEYSVNAMERQLKRILSTHDLTIQREAFSSFNGTLYTTVKTFGIRDEVSFYQFCPMAFNRKGAYWFSNENNIRNPYMGEQMLACGMTKKIIR